MQGRAALGVRRLALDCFPPNAITLFVLHIEREDKNTFTKRCYFPASILYIIFHLHIKKKAISALIVLPQKFLRQRFPDIYIKWFLRIFFFFFFHARWFYCIFSQYLNFFRRIYFFFPYYSDINLLLFFLLLYLQYDNTIIFEGGEFLNSFVETLILSSDSVEYFALEMVEGFKSLSINDLDVFWESSCFSTFAIRVLFLLVFSLVWTSC